MNKLLLVILTIFLLFISVSARAKLSGIAGKGGKDVKTSTTTTYQLLETYPGCTVDVYLAGTTTHASIYSNNAGTVKSNPFFSSSSDASWFFYADNGRYDIKFSGTGITSPFTLGDYIFTDNIITGPSSCVDNAIARYDGITGKIIQCSSATISDTGTLKIGITASSTTPSRFEMATRDPTVVSSSVLATTFNNGPVSLPTYTTHSYCIACYNASNSGAKLINGIPSWGLFAEMPFYSSTSAGPEFVTEWHLNYLSADGLTSKRFFGASIGDTSYTPEWFFYGLFSWRDTNGNVMMQYEPANARLDLTWNANNQIRLPNNKDLIFADFVGTSSIPAIKVNASNQVVVASGGQDVLIPGSAFINSNIDASQFRITGDTDTLIRSVFSGFLDFYSNNVRVFSTQPTGVNVVGVPLVCETDGTCDFGKVSGTNHRFDNSYIRTLSESGTFKSTVTTGTAPLDITSTTPVSNLNLTSHPKVYNISGTLQTSVKIITGTGTLSAGTVVVTFSSNAIFANTSYICTGANQTNLNPFKIANTSASSITITGTGTDVIGFNCTGQ